MLFKLKIISIAAFIVIFSTDTVLSETLKLSFSQTLERAGGNNYEIKIAAAQVDAVKADLNKSAAVFLPQITLSEKFIRTNDPLNVFGLKLKQKRVSQMDFNPALLNNPD